MVHLYGSYICLLLSMLLLQQCTSVGPAHLCMILEQRETGTLRSIKNNDITTVLK